VTTSVPSLAVPGRTLEGTRIHLSKLPTGFSLYIVTPNDGDGWELYEGELQEAWEALESLVAAREDVDAQR
jgi:hypothetical protein